LAPLLKGRSDQKGSTGRDNRMFVEGVLGAKPADLHVQLPTKFELE
jgi:hypothetical protein